jgi:hypothetical protein
MGALYPRIKKSIKLRTAYFILAAQVKHQVDSQDTYICSTLARTAYLVASGGTIDITTPNLVSIDKASIAGKYGKAFWNDLRDRGLLCLPDAIAKSGVLTRVD